MKLLLGLIVTLVATSHAKVFFEEQFKDGKLINLIYKSNKKLFFYRYYSLLNVFINLNFDLDSWSDRWVQSEHKDDLGKFELSAGSFYGDAEKDKGIKTSQDAKFYGLSAKFEKV